jgi:ectoine hydroxylase-related dioxygenase (phytanoyl-CoA dioxygenase family)
LLERLPDVRTLAHSEELRTLVEPILGPRWRPVRGIYFDKTLSANWKVPWHQDLTIAVHETREAEGFGPWSTKAGVPHVRPPVAILEQMLAVRIALDDNDETNGPLRVLPGTHRFGRLQPADIASLRSEIPEVSCCVPAGAALLMRPLLLHASSPMTSGKRRRVIHIEYAGCDLPGGLEWRS